MEEALKNPGKLPRADGQSRFPRKHAPDNFRRYPPEAAKVLAHKAREAFRANQDFAPTAASRCFICTHFNREEIDRLVLSGAGLSELREAIGLAAPESYKWTAGRFRHHRDNHLLPLIATEVMPAIQGLRALPYPKDGTDEELAWWYFFQNYALYGDAVEKGNVSAASRVLREMREIDFTLIRNRYVAPPKPVEPPPPPPDSAPPIKAHAEPTKLELALQRSRIHKDDYKPPVDEGIDGEA